jgi:hypothetical protein
VKTPEERDAERAARHEAGTTRHLELPVAPEEAHELIHEAMGLRAPMRLMREHTWTADIIVPGSYFGGLGTGGNIGAAAMVLGYGPVVHLSYAPFEGGTQFTARTESIGMMLAIRPEIYSLFNALTDAWDARQRP